MHNTVFRTTSLDRTTERWVRFPVDQVAENWRNEHPPADGFVARIAGAGVETVSPITLVRNTLGVKSIQQRVSEDNVHEWPCTTDDRQ